VCRGGSIARFSEECGVPVSTLKTWLRSVTKSQQRDLPPNVQAKGRSLIDSHTRRDFFRHLSIDVVAAIVVNSVLKVYERLFPEGHVNSGLKACDFLDLVTHDGKSVQLSCGIRPPLDDDQEPMRGICEYLRSRNPTIKLHFVNSLPDYDRNLGDICFGAPVSNQLAAARLGYSGYGERISHDISKGLAFYYVQDVGQVKGQCRRYFDGDIVSSPNWFITDTVTKRQFVTEVDEQGFLASDYLLVTRLVDDEKGISVIGGTHGPGTRAFGYLLSDKNLCDSASRGIFGENESFQSLSRVTGLTHDHVTKRSSEKPILEHIKTQVLFRA
jgi:hypothetical protein